MVTVVGAGLAGCEVAYQLARRGHKVRLIEMRPLQTTPAHKSDQFAELVCSNSFGSETDYSAPGQLKWEAAQLGSLILQCAKQCQVPAGMALSVDRTLFAKFVTETVRSHPLIEVVNAEVANLGDIPRPAVICTGPLTATPLAESLLDHFGDEFLFFFDAIAPIIDADSIDEFKVFRGNRFESTGGDYLNCGLTKEQYYLFIEAVSKARKIEPKAFEETPYFEGCMPLEALIERGVETPRFGPMSPKGLHDPKTGQGFYAVVQLRQENLNATAYNMVGFQTRMAYGEQTRVFRMIPGLEQAEFLKLGSIHRNLYIHSPKRLTKTLSSQKDPDLFFAGQITGVEGYFESTCIGLLVAEFVSSRLINRDKDICLPSSECALGALLQAITFERENFQPTNINMGLFPPMSGIRDKRMKRQAILDRAKRSFTQWRAYKPKVNWT